MNLFRNGFGVLLLTGILAVSARAQTVDDAIRFSTPASVVSARAAGLGNAFIGVADDFSSIYFNPAGLALLRRAEFSAGLMNYNGETESTFLNQTMTDNDGNFSLNNLGLALPFPVDRGSLVIGVGYMKLLDYTDARAYGGYNSQSSIIPTLYNPEADFDLAWQTGLEEFDEATGIITMPIHDQVEQLNQTLLSGSLSQWSFGGSAEVAKDFMVGLSLNVLTGEFISDRTFTETDINGVHQQTINGFEGASTDFLSLDYREFLEQQVSGFNIKFGGLYNYNNIARFGVTIQTPTSINIDENYNVSSTATFADVTDQFNLNYNTFNYSYSTPWVFGFGASYAPLDFLRVSGDLEMRDYTDIEFDNIDDLDSFARDLNLAVREYLRSTMNYRFGVEFQVPHTGLILRGGYGINQSPYDPDVAEQNEAPAGLNADETTISGGIGYILQDRIILNVTYSMATRDQYRFVYNDPDPATNVAPPAVQFVRTEETATRSALMFSMSYLF